MKCIINKTVTYILLIVIVFWVLISVTFTEVSADECIDKLNNKKIYYFSWSEIRQVTANIGYPDFIDHKMARAFRDNISRNADGTAIFVFNRLNNKAIVFSCDGSVKQLELPSTFSWLDNDNNILAWPEDRINHGKRYLKGYAPVSCDAVDPSGKYIISYFDNKYYAIFAITNPEIPLAKVNITSGDFLNIFLKGNKLYVFGYDVVNMLAPLKAFIYERDGEKFKMKEEFEIPREEKYPTPYLVNDLSPWNDEILLMDVRTFPSLSKWYVYNLKTKELRYEGPAISNKGLFLQCDILQKVGEKINKGNASIK
jgi:hypothetical protein